MLPRGRPGARMASLFSWSPVFAGTPPGYCPLEVWVQEWAFMPLSTQAHSFIDSGV